MIARKFSPCLWALFMLPMALSAQVIRGIVREAQTNEALVGVTIQAWQKDSARAEGRTATDLNGQFLLENLPPGTYRLQARYTGFDSKTLAELPVAAGKDLFLDISMEFNRGLICPGPIIWANKRAPQPLSEIALPRERVARYPTTFFDPARLAMAFPGVAQTNDGINGMSIRGNGPASVQWRLEGVEIVNPNHLPNAGTFSDLPTAASGGVLMFSAQMLDDASLLTGAQPAEYAGTVGGVMDMSLRAGNDRRHEFTAQAGLVGLDLAAEGPMGRKNEEGRRPSYLANYRYSTVGLLGQMGVSFGDEQINFQDLAFALNFPMWNNGYVKFFGMGGKSENIFRHKADTAEITTNKDWQDIDFESITGLAGVSVHLRQGKTELKFASVLSRQSNDWQMVSHRDTTTTFGGDKLLIGRKVHCSDLVGTMSLALQHTATDDIRVRYGAQIKVRSIDWGIPSFRMEPFGETTWKFFNGILQATPALHVSMIGSEEDETYFQPRLTVVCKPFSRHIFSAFWGDVAGYFEEFGHTDLFRNNQASLKYGFVPSEKWLLQVEFFAQNLSKVPVLQDIGRTWILNENAPTSSFSGYDARGEGQNRGIELAAERLFSDGWFASANATLLDSRFRIAPDETWQNTRWDIGHILNIAGGKEWARQKSAAKTKTFGFSARAVWTGGFREMPISLAASQAAALGATVFDPSMGFSTQLPDYFRVDGRVYWKKSLSGQRNTTFALECQNMTNRQNAGWHYYERQTDEVALKYQLGLIPNLSWRIEF